MQDGAPPHWTKAVRDWLNSNLQQRWIGRGGVEDNNISWPARSSNLTPMDFFLWGFLKSKAFVKDYENIDSLKAAITAVFQEIAREMINSTLRSFEKRLIMVIESQGRHVEK